MNIQNSNCSWHSHLYLTLFFFFFGILEIRKNCFGGSGYFLFSAYAFSGLFTGVFPVCTFSLTNAINCMA